MSEHVIVETEGAMLRVRLNRPEKKNALTLAMYEALTEALRRLDDDAQLRVLLLTGTDDCFTSGNDIGDFMQSPPTDESSPVLRFLRAISTAKKPIVAAVAGVAVGIGTTVLLHCDLVYAGEGATFRLPFVNLGLVPEAGSSLILPHLVGHAKAAELLMLGEPFDARTAAALHLVSGVVPDADVLDHALDKAHRLAALPPAALRHTKALLKSTFADAVQARIHDEGELFVQRLRSPEAAEAFQAFLERRPPDFSSFS